MPKIKVDHVVSFSSEDNVHIASHILNNDMSKKWKCQTAGEPSVSVILQLEKAMKISGVDICNECSAFVEVLVGRSSTNGDDFKPILIMSSFMTPMESRDVSTTNRVRLFTYKDLASDTRDEKWDRIKFNCTQPFNKRIQYGLSYVTLYTPQEKEEKEELVPVSLGKFLLRPESPDTLSAGSLFANRKEEKETPSEEMKKLSSKEWLEKHGTPKAQSIKIQPSTSNAISKNTETPTTKKRNIDLFYDSDDDKPHEKIDKVIAKKREEDAEKKKLESKETPNKKDKKTSKTEKTPKESKTDKTPKETKNVKINKTPKQDSRTPTNTPSSTKRKIETTPNPVKKKVKLISRPFNQLMNDVVFTISGIVNPERANLREKALELGAKYKPNWDNYCTHLICAFANTPKFKEVQGKGKIVKKNWIDDCHTQRKRLPWRRYALDRNDQGNSESEDEICETQQEQSDIEEENHTRNNNVSGSDTEDEVERILAKQKESQGKKEEREIESDEENWGKKADMNDQEKKLKENNQEDEEEEWEKQCEEKTVNNGHVKQNKGKDWKKKYEEKNLNQSPQGSSKKFEENTKYNSPKNKQNPKKKFEDFFDEDPKSQKKKNEDFYDEEPKSKQTPKNKHVDEAQSKKKVVDPYDADTDEEKLVRNSKPFTDKILKIFDKEMFYIDNVFSNEDRRKLERLIKITNGYVLDEPRVVVDYIITDEENAAAMNEQYFRAKVVSAQWILDVYDKQKMVEVNKYLLE